ncbi:MAG: hypothetical protein K0Q68_2954 [Moraxellaceae bacterium]|jgi:hypothetical protein|nr:hypothetical protein [Moraxellaceae bacterium]
MTTGIDHDRRRLLGATAVAGIALLGAGGCQARDALPRTLAFASLDEAAGELARMAQAPALDAAPGWSWAQTLVHCAQSIEYSLAGFPVMKPALFRRTVGPAAFRAFAWRGRMSHDLAEPIPGAPALAPAQDVAIATARLQGALQAFRQATGPLRPHFAYGELSKAEYELAHALHLANHFSAFMPRA